MREKRTDLDQVIHKLQNKIRSLQQAIEYTTLGLKEDKYSIELISEAPKWLQIVSRGSYCAYKNTVYVPLLHLQLVASKFEEDRTLGTAKILPWIMLIQDKTEHVSVYTSIKSLLFLSYQLHYFIYEFLFLSATNHPFKEAIGLGFMASRKRIGIRIPVKTIKKYLEDILKTNQL